MANKKWNAYIRFLRFLNTERSKQKAAELELAELEAIADKLAICDYRLSPPDHDLIESLFPGRIEAAYTEAIRQAWYWAARITIRDEIEKRTKQIDPL